MKVPKRKRGGHHAIATLIPKGVWCPHNKRVWVINVVLYTHPSSHPERTVGLHILVPLWERQLIDCSHFTREPLRACFVLVQGPKFNLGAQACAQPSWLATGVTTSPCCLKSWDSEHDDSATWLPPWLTERPRGATLQDFKSQSWAQDNLMPSGYKCQRELWQLLVILGPLDSSLEWEESFSHHLGKLPAQKLDPHTGFHCPSIPDLYFSRRIGNKTRVLARIF